MLEDFEIFSDHWVVTERENGLTRIKVKRWDETEDYFIPVPGKTYSISGSLNPNFETSNFRFSYTSLSTPTTIFEYDMNSKTKKILRRYQNVAVKTRGKSAVELPPYFLFDNNKADVR